MSTSEWYWDELDNLPPEWIRVGRYGDWARDAVARFGRENRDLRRVVRDQLGYIKSLEAQLLPNLITQPSLDTYSRSEQG